MIISHKYQFIFIKSRKTAGTSIEVFLSQLCDHKDVLTPIFPSIYPHKARNCRGFWNPVNEILWDKTYGTHQTFKDLVDRNRFYNHIPATLVKHRIPKDVWNSYFKFCVDRNPWDKTLSHYHMVNDRSGGKVSLERYFKEKRFCINYPLYTSHKGNLLVDRVIKYESLMKDLDDIFQNLGIPFEGSLGVRAKSEHRKDRRPYQEVLTPEQRFAIQTAFDREIKMHGYVF